MELWNQLGRLSCVLIACTLAGCSSHSDVLSKNMQPPSVVLATPLQVTYQNELALARLGQLLATNDLNSDQRAALFYERGMMFDKVGLRTMARIDFSRALREKPDFAEAYNFIGVYLTQQQDFDNAYDAFDSALELAPGYDYVYLNRGIALYYAHRPELAVKDMEVFQQHKPDDPYRALWLFLTSAQLDRNKAMETLVRQYDDHRNDEWGWNIVKVYTGKQDAAEFIRRIADSTNSNRQLAERLCEAYFYLAKLSQLQGNTDAADAYFKLSLANNVFDFIEHRYALLELQLANQAPNSYPDELDFEAE
ncbi:lipoprotein NlpI [Tolumonas osonensis]|nr:lipoprotein NlpI [Tolumonas osonensis]